MVFFLVQAGSVVSKEEIVKLTTMKMGLSLFAIAALLAASAWAQNSGSSEPGDVRSDTHDIPVSYTHLTLPTICSV